MDFMMVWLIVGKLECDCYVVEVVLVEGDEKRLETRDEAHFIYVHPASMMKVLLSSLLFILRSPFSLPGHIGRLVDSAEHRCNCTAGPDLHMKSTPELPDIVYEVLQLQVRYEKSLQTRISGKEEQIRTNLAAWCSHVADVRTGGGQSGQSMDELSRYLPCSSLSGEAGIREDC